MNLNAYFRLMRLHKPIGIILLWLPVAWALWIAQHGAPSVKLLTIFFMGTVIMRSAGCVVNDIADRNIDKHVKRTHERPLASGEVGFIQALVLLIILLCLAFLVVIQLPIECFYFAIVALSVTILYPFCKRFLHAPQLVLGIAFSMGIPMVYVASNKPMDMSFILLFMLNFFWIIAYDTMYAMVDREDDLRIGVQSTAILFGVYDRLVILLLQLLMHSTWILLGLLLHLSRSFYVLWFISSGFLIYQQMLIRRLDPKHCFLAFLNNTWYGVAMWIALMVGQ